MEHFLIREQGYSAKDAFKEASKQPVELFEEKVGKLDDDDLKLHREFERRVKRATMPDSHEEEAVALPASKKSRAKNEVAPALPTTTRKPRKKKEVDTPAPAFGGYRLFSKDEFPDE